ncbi:MAG: hypothetical protein ACPG4U_17125, partial [Pseudomonadales bacterium]
MLQEQLPADPVRVAEIISMIKDLIIAAAAITTALIAYRGLNKWKSEVVFKAQFETALNLAKKVHVLRDEIESFRSPIYTSDEFTEEYNQSPVKA